MLADPEGEEFCVVEADNAFLAGTGRIGALSCDGTRAVGLFWRDALAWPLVWDEGEETAIQSPSGGTKIAWGGPPVAPRQGLERLRLDLTPAQGAAIEDEIVRLESLGAMLATDELVPGEVTMVDPDGNEFSIAD